MNAQQANQSSDDKNIQLDQQQMVRIQNAIKEAISKGEYECTVFESITEPNKDTLRADGYQIDRRGGRLGENNWLIKWDGAEDDCGNDCNANTTYYPGGHPDPQYPL